MSPSGRLCLLTIVGLILPTRGKAEPLSPLCPRVPHLEYTGGGWAGAQWISIACPVSLPSYRGSTRKWGLGGGDRGYTLFGHLAPGWPLPMSLARACPAEHLHFTSKKNSLSLVWLGDWCQFSTEQPGTLGSQQSRSWDSRVIRVIHD